MSMVGILQDNSNQQGLQFVLAVFPEDLLKIDHNSGSGARAIVLRCAVDVAFKIIRVNQCLRT